MAKVALLIGVSEYEPGLPALPAAIKDVEAMQRVLQQPEMGGFTASDIKVLKNPERQEMEEEIQALFDDRHRDDLVLFFFSGHGTKDITSRFYLSSRKTRKTARGELVRPTATVASFLHENMKNSRSKRQVIILDCCFSGVFADGLSAKDDGSVDIRSQLGSEGAAVLTSSSSIEYSFEQQGSDLSVYTRYLIEGIETGAADQDNDGSISIDELHEYAKRKVQETVPAMKPEIYAVKEGFKILLAKASIGDPKLRYRKDVEQFASRGEISEIARIGLEAKRVKLGLLPEEAAAIEAEVVQPYQIYKQNLQQYEQEFNKAAKRQFPFSSETRNDLKYLQQALGLRDSDVAPIEAKFTQIEVKNESDHNQSLKLDPNSSLRINPTPDQDINADLDAGLRNKPQQFAAYPEAQPQKQRQQDAENRREQQEEVEYPQKPKKNQSSNKSKNRSLVLVGIIGSTIAAGIVLTILPKLNNVTNPVTTESTIQPTSTTKPTIQPTPGTNSSATNDQNLLKQAKAEAQNPGDLQEAINIAAKIPSDSPANPEAQNLILEWKADWEKYNNNFQQIDLAYQAGNWLKVVNIAYDPNQLPRNPYWDQKVNDMAINAKNRLKAPKFNCQCAQDSSNNPNAKGLGDPFISETNRQKEPCNTETRFAGFLHCTQERAYRIQSNDGKAAVRELPNIQSAKVRPDQKSGTVVSCGDAVQGEKLEYGNQWRYCKELGGFIHSHLLDLYE